jgi:O-antigen/teichoic acid export membrane protein
MKRVPGIAWFVHQQASGMVDADSHSPSSRHQSLLQRALNGSAWTLFGYGTIQVVRFASNLLLTHLLFPKAFGLMALVNVLMQGLAMFSDFGIGPAVVKHRHWDDRAFYNTAWTIQIARGFGLWLVGSLLAVPMAMIYGEPELAKYIPIAALTAVLTGFNSMKLFTAARDMKFGRLTTIEVVSQLVAAAVMILLAVFTQSVWSLVTGGLSQAALKAVFTHLLLDGPRDKIELKREALVVLYQFGGWIFLSTIFTFLAMQADRLLLGRLMSIELLGVYSVAVGLMAVVSGVFGQFSTRVLMPVMVQFQRSLDSKFESVVSGSRALVINAAAIMCAVIVLAAPSLFSLLYDPRYKDAGWMAQLLGFGLWFSLLQQVNQTGVLVGDRSRALALSNGANFFVTLFLAPCGFMICGVGGFIIGWALGNLVGLIMLDIELERHVVAVKRQDTIASIYFFALCIVGWALQRFLAVTFGSQHQIWTELLPLLLLIGMGGAALYSSGRKFVSYYHAA